MNMLFVLTLIIGMAITWTGLILFLGGCMRYFAWPAHIKYRGKDSIKTGLYLLVIGSICLAACF